MTKIVVEIEEAILKEAMRLYRNDCTRRALRELEQSFEYRFCGYYRKDSGSLLASLCERHGSDKGAIRQEGHSYAWPPHSYTDVYASWFDHCRSGIGRVFECGIGTTNQALPSNMGPNGKPGASLRVWRDYFTSAEVIGADIDKDVLFAEERIRTFHVDQTDPVSIRELWRSVGRGEFDFMVDDGLHSFDAGICLFENSFAQLKSGGIYVIEDVSVADLLKYRDYFRDRRLHVTYLSLVRPGVELNDNCLIVVRNAARGDLSARP